MGFGDIQGPKRYKFIMICNIIGPKQTRGKHGVWGRGGHKPKEIKNEIIRFVAMDVTRRYEIQGFGALDVTKPYEIVRFGHGMTQWWRNTPSDLT